MSPSKILSFTTSMKIIKTINEAKKLLQRGGLLAYPTEAVYGLGCDPFNQMAVEALFKLKGRDPHKGLILLISNWQQLTPLIAPVTDEQLAKVHATWPGFVTWIFPKSATLPEWLTGKHNSIAIRMSAHPIANALCAEAPLVSTSANRSGHPPAISENELHEQFPTGIDAFVQGSLGGFSKPSAIFDVLSGVQIR